MSSVVSQCDTSNASIQQIMRSKAFARGHAEVMSGQPPNYDGPLGHQWAYERGRLFALIYPCQFKMGKQIADAALEAFDRAFVEGVML